MPQGVNVGDDMTLKDAVIVRGLGESTDGIRISDDRVTAGDDLAADGSIAFAITGKPRQGEDGGRQACQVLREHLNNAGAMWGEPVKPVREEGVDWELHSGSDLLKIQVTRAEVDPQFWRTLGQTGSQAGSILAERVADALRATIEAKRTRAAKDVVLVLDATDTPRFAFEPVVDSFRREQGPWATQVGFKEIWVVGPVANLASRLDAAALRDH